MKKLLMVAFHYPPASGTSGVQRALRFSSHLPEFGWQPIVLSANPRAYEHRSTDLMSEIVEDVTVIRAQAWDTKRHLSIAGRYPTAMALPDRWSTWALGAVPAGMRAIRTHKPDAIWSTYPIATAHRIAASLAERSGLPLVADFRDPMAQEGYPEDPRVWQSFDSVEKRVVNAASICTFTTPGAKTLYMERYPESASRFHLLENGYDEAVFSNAPKSGGALNEDKLTLLHSGIVYPSERDPESLFAAMRNLRESDPVQYSRLVVRFRAAVHEDLLIGLARQYGVDDAVQLLPSVSYSDAIQEMQRADGLLILQASNCNAQIPAKFYEYLRAGRPILMVTDPIGDTATASREYGLGLVAEFGNEKAISAALSALLSGSTDAMRPEKLLVKSATRRSRTESLTQLLDLAISS